MNVARGTHPLSPVSEDHEGIVAAARQVMTDEQIEEIFRLYPQDHWLIELEAFTVMEIFTAAEIAELFAEACVL